MEESLDHEIEALLQKYAGGQMPPFVDLENPESGLIDGELLQIYHSGVLSRHSLPLGILLAARHYTSLEEKWRKGDFTLNEWARAGWSPFCKTLRDKDVGDQACEECDRRRAITAERAGDVIAYLCDNGMIDFAVPISVKGRVVAVLVCGQFKPREGSIWNPELIQRDGCFRPLTPGEEGEDVWDESQRRIREIEQRAGLPEGALLEALSNNAHPAGEISPQEVEEIQELLRKVAAQLSNLATSTYELEKGKVVDWIRNHITRSLTPLSAAPVETLEVWKRLSLGLEYTIRYFELDYVLILSCCNETEEGIKVLCHSGLPEANFPMGERLSATTASLSTLRSTVCRLEEPAPIVLRDYKNLPLFDRLNRLHAEQSKRALVIPIPAPLGSGLLVMILGKLKRDIDLNACSPDDREALIRIIEGVALVAEIIPLVEQLEGTAKKQARFLEDVAHDIRTPIQNIIIEAEVLVHKSASSDEVNRRTHRLAAQARRLHLISQRAWTLVGIDQEVFKLDETELVNVYQILMRSRKSLADLAGERGIKILVDPEKRRRGRKKLAEWPRIRVNKALFTQAVLNLLDNAIKYSHKGTEVRVDGRLLPDGVSLSFVNRGIPVQEGEKAKIFERYYRSKEARMYIQAGTGIGLSIVKAFVEHCQGSVEVNSVPIKDTQDYVTEFKVFIPYRR